MARSNRVTRSSGAPAFDRSFVTYVRWACASRVDASLSEAPPGRRRSASLGCSWWGTETGPDRPRQPWPASAPGLGRQRPPSPGHAGGGRDRRSVDARELTPALDQDGVPPSARSGTDDGLRDAGPGADGPEAVPFVKAKARRVLGEDARLDGPDARVLRGL